MKFQNHPWMEQLNEEFPEVEIFGPQCISAEVGPGWIKLLRPALQALSDSGCKVEQIKQKFGGLRLYWGFPGRMEKDERNRVGSIIDPLVKEAERLSYETCESCGVSINPPRPPGYKTQCDDCKSAGVRGVRGP